MEITFTGTQIMEALAPVYSAAYDEYLSLLTLSTQLLQEDEDRAYKVIARRAVNKTHFLDGMQEAVKALGLDPLELIGAAARVDKEVNHAADKT